MNTANAGPMLEFQTEGSPFRKAVRIQLLGDADAGKSSLILSLICEEYCDARGDATEMRHRTRSTMCEDVTIPAEITMDRVLCVISDYPDVHEDNITERQALIDVISRADVVCLVYDCTSRNAMSRLTSFWMSTINHAGETKPVVLAANKADLLTSSETFKPSTDPDIMSLINSYPQIHCCVECSSRAMHNVPELFYTAQKSIIYPMGPLFNIATGTLRPDFSECLRHVFSILDYDRAGALDDTALVALQTVSTSNPRRSSSVYFRHQLTHSRLASLKGLIRQKSDAYLDQNDRLNCDGFLYLFQLILEHDSTETVWAILRIFFDDDFHFFSVNDKCLLRHNNVMNNGSVCLTSPAINFLADLYSSYHRAHGQVTTEVVKTMLRFLDVLDSDIDEIILNVSFTSQKPVIVDGASEIDLQQFIQWWVYHAFTDGVGTLRWLAMLGFEFWNNEDICGGVGNIDHSQCGFGYCVIAGDCSPNHRAADFYDKVRGCVMFSTKKQVVNNSLHMLLGHGAECKNTLEWAVYQVPIIEPTSYLVLTSLGPDEVSGALRLENINTDSFCLVCDAKDPESVFGVLSLYNAGLSTCHNEQEQAKLPRLILLVLNCELMQESSCNYCNNDKLANLRRFCAGNNNGDCTVMSVSSDVAGNPSVQQRVLQQLYMATYPRASWIHRPPLVGQLLTDDGCVSGAVDGIGDNPSSSSSDFTNGHRDYPSGLFRWTSELIDRIVESCWQCAGYFDQRRTMLDSGPSGLFVATLSGSTILGIVVIVATSITSGVCYKKRWCPRSFKLNMFS